MRESLKERAHVRRAIVILGLACVVFLAVWKLPEWPVLAWKAFLTPKDLIELENQTRQTLIQVIAGAAIVAGLYLVWRRMTATEHLAGEALATVREGQLTDRFSRAVQQFGSDKVEIRLGGIYALERIAQESERDHWPVMEVLCAYVREAAAWREERPAARLSVDVQAVLTVVGRRSRRFETAEHHRINLSRTDLRMADLQKAQLGNALLVGCHLEGADLGNATLEKADLRGAFLSETDLVQANLAGADLREAHLEGAYLVEARLTGADMAAARLDGAYLGGAHLENADLSGAYLEGAYLHKAKMEGASLHGARMVNAVGLSRELRAQASLAKAEAEAEDEEHLPHMPISIDDTSNGVDRVTPIRARA
jgi:uncharacterized protein YjbI with pentapeptide repeats